AKLSIHLVSQHPDDSTKIQYEVGKRNNISQVVWVSRGAESAKCDFLQELRDEPRTNLEYLERRTLGQMQEVVFDLLGPMPSPPPPETPSDRLPLIYLMCAREDHP